MPEYALVDQGHVLTRAQTILALSMEPQKANRPAPGKKAHPSFISGRLQEASEAARGLGQGW